MSKRNYEIIVFSDEWKGLPCSSKHLIRHFLADVPVIWVETIGLRSPRLNTNDISRVKSKITAWASKTTINKEAISKNLYIINPVQIPYNHIGFVRKLNKQILIRTLNRFYQGRTKRERVLITTWPFLGNIVGSLGESISIYYRVDDNSELPGVRRDVIRSLEKELIKKVDMVIATAKKLTQIDIYGKIVKYLPHGVDFEHFTKKSNDRKNNLPIQRIPMPRIGFFGLLNEWIDFELMSLVATDHPDWSFVFIGPSQLPPSCLPKAPNIHFLGPVSYDELPSHARYFDVALIPFKINALTEAVNPIKLMEYFSIGIPVVSTPIPEVIKYKNYTAIASDTKSFGAAIKSALDQDNQNARLSRQHLAKAHSWQKKALKLRNWIETDLDLKNSKSP